MLNWEDLPLILSVKDVSMILGIGRNAVYNLFHRKGFPKMIFGRNFRVEKNSLRDWLKSESETA
jgi:excisionase family DNA binding protein